MTVTSVEFDPMNPEFLRDPYPTFRRLRQDAPVHYTDFAGGFWLVTRHADLKTIVRDPSLRNGRDDSGHFAKLAGGPAERFYPSILNQLDGESHARLRKVGEKALARRTLVQTIGPKLLEFADDALNGVLEAGEVDALADFAHEIPLKAFCGLLDLPQADRHMLYGWIGDFFGIFVPDALDEDGIQRTHQAVQNFIDYLTPVIQERRRNPGDDVVSMFVMTEADGERLTDDEVMTLATQTMAGGFDTSSAMIAAGIHCLANAPDQMARLRQDPDGLAAAAVEEVMRWESPVQMTPRYAAADTEIAGTTIPAGAGIGCLVGSANRDETVFNEPDRFLVDRTELHDRSTAPLHFGGGPHFCIGNQLARLEGEAAFSALARRCADIEPAGESQRAITTMVRRGFAKVPVRFVAG